MSAMNFENIRKRDQKAYDKAEYIMPEIFYMDSGVVTKQGQIKSADMVYLNTQNRLIYV
jgi:hypothetical protein